MKKGRGGIHCNWQSLMNPIKGINWGKVWEWSALPVCACALLLVFVSVMQIGLVGSTSVTPSAGPCLLIDPGHGGADGGAVAADGTQEKDLNLSIGLLLRDMLRIMGYEVRMTRTEDISIHSPDCKTLREQKVGDMKNRLAMYEEASLVVGIHQNKFEIPKYSGTQVFYSVNNPESKLLATELRESVLGLLQPENTRELKKADANIYLLSKTTVPAVLVECGFLSNLEELQKLKDPAYQAQMAFAIAGGVMQYGPRA